MSETQQLISGDKLSLLTGLTDRRHRQLAKEGYFPPPENGQYQWALTIRGLFKYYREHKERTHGELAEEKLAKMRTDRKLSELRLAQQQGYVIDREVVLEMLAVLSQKLDLLLRLKLEVELGPRISGKSAAEANVEGGMILDEIREVINANLAQFRNDALQPIQPLQSVGNSGANSAENTPPEAIS